MGKCRIIAETGAGQHGVATAAVCAKLGLTCRVYMGETDIRRQRPNVFWMERFGAEVVPVRGGAGTLKDAVNEALRDWAGSYRETHYLLGVAFPALSGDGRQFQTLNPQSKIAGRDLLVDNIEALRKYEERGIPGVEGSPAAMLKDARRKREEVVLTAAHAELQDMMAKVKKAATWEAKRRLYSTFLLRMGEYKKKLDDPSHLKDLELHVRCADHQAQLDAIISQARGSELAGAHSVAARTYREAADLLKKSCLQEPARTRLMVRSTARSNRRAAGSRAEA